MSADVRKSYGTQNSWKTQKKKVLEEQVPLQFCYFLKVRCVVHMHIIQILGFPEALKLLHFHSVVPMSSLRSWMF